MMKKSFLLPGLLICLLNTCKVFAQNEDVPQYQVKAVFLFNFTRFVDWPASAFPEPGRLFIIGVLGDDPFGSYLHDAVFNEMVNGRRIVIRHYNSVEKIKGCQILFIGKMEEGRLSRVLKILKGQPVLTVGEANGFCNKGGMIRLYTENNNIRFRINNEAARESQLRISSKMLSLANVPDN